MTRNSIGHLKYRGPSKMQLLFYWKCKQIDKYNETEFFIKDKLHRKQFLAVHNLYWEASGRILERGDIYVKL